MPLSSSQNPYEFKSLHALSAFFLRYSLSRSMTSFHCWIMHHQTFSFYWLYHKHFTSQEYIILLYLYFFFVSRWTHLFILLRFWATLRLSKGRIKSDLSPFWMASQYFLKHSFACVSLVALSALWEAQAICSAIALWSHATQRSEGSKRLDSLAMD